MILVHYLDNSRAHRLVWLLEELGLPYDLKLYHRGKNLLAPPELRKIHPLGKSPVIDDDGLVLAESGAIFEYLLGRYDPKGLVPAQQGPDWPTYLYFLHSAEGSAMPLLVNRLVFSELKKRAPWIVRPVAAAIADRLDGMLVARALPAMFGEWEAALAPTGWFAGEFSAADIMMSFPVQGAVDRAAAAERRPHLAAFVKRIAERPAYRRALERGEFVAP